MQPFPVPILPYAPAHPAAHRAGGERRSQLPPAAGAGACRPALAGSRGRGRRGGVGRGRSRASRGGDRRLVAAGSGSERVPERLQRKLSRGRCGDRGGLERRREPARALPAGTALRAAPQPGDRHGGVERGSRDGRSANRAAIAESGTAEDGADTEPTATDPAGSARRAAPIGSSLLAAAHKDRSHSRGGGCSRYRTRAPRSACRSWWAMPPACSRSAAACVWWPRA